MFRILLSKPIFILLIFILIFYMWIGTDGRESYVQYHPKGWYNLLVDGFLKGQLHFPVKVPEELLNLPDPYNPALNGPYRLHDMAYYKGKYYLYYGVTAAIVFYLPFRLLTGIQPEDNYVIMFFMFLGLVFAVLTLYYIRNKYFPKVPDWLLLFLVGALGFANVAPFILKRTMMYEVASSSGYFFLNSGIYFLLKALNSKENLIKLLVAGSLFLGLAIGGRPHFIFAGVVLLIVYFKLMRKRNSSNFVFLSREIASLFLPYACLIILYALYNYFRFESPFEFGLKYIHAGHYVKNYKFLDFANFTNGLYLYFLQKPEINFMLPFIHINSRLPAFLPTPHAYFFIGIVGILYCIPLISLAILGTFVCLFGNIVKKFSLRHNQFPIFDFLILFVSGTIILLFLILAPQVEFRYISDFATLYMLAAFIVIFYIDSLFLSVSKLKKTFRALIIISAILSISFGIAFGTDPYFRSLQNKNPALYNRIESNLKPFVDIFI